MNENRTVTTLPENGGEGHRVIESTALFGRDSEIIIRHQGADYHMKITRQGKLILNK
ncbi:hemin uptake protein HemP [Martelella alba]|uniref:Hemin uptake protein HemP n=1 Tax=Martelella alba TaxID=2590451 RepID=A0A506UAJ1_9HYPH|nr:hemin uptake protein HemP [Martelella alba]TPW30538.1 hemin uptake protein HemP [Martelella alba]